MKNFLQKNKWFILILVLFGLYLWKLPLQTQDGPNHKKVAVILERLDRSPVESGVYQSNLGPFQTNEIFPLLYLPASRFVSADTYEKIFVGFFLLLLPITYRYFLSVWSPGSVSLWIIIFPLWFHPLFIQGMYNFLASVPLTLLALALLKKGIESRRGGILVLFCLCCYLAFLAHPFPFFALSLTLFIMAFQEPRQNAVFVGIYGFITLLFLILGFAIPLLHSSSAGAKSPYLFSTIPELLFNLFNSSFTAYSLLQLLLMIPFCLLMLALMFFSFSSTPWRKKIYWILFLTAYALFPNGGSGGGYINQRFLPFAWAFLPLGLTLTSIRLKQIRILSLLTVLVSAGFLFEGMSRVNLIAQDARAALTPLPDQSRLYFINFDSRGPGLNYPSLYHLWASYHDSKTVFSPNLFAHMDLMPLARRKPSSATYFPSAPENFASDIIKAGCKKVEILDTITCENFREESFRKIFHAAFYYDYWFLYRPPPEFLTFIESIPELKKISEKNGASLWHYEKAFDFEPPLARRPTFVETSSIDPN